MKYTENGLRIGLDELRELLGHAEASSKNGDMEYCIYIKGGDRPKITQYCSYAECAPINHTINAK